MRLLSLLGLILVGYSVWRLVMFAIEDYTRRVEVRQVMEGRELPPWEPRTVRIRRPLHDADEDF